MVEKQAAWDEHLIGTVQALMVALSRTDLVVDSAQGRVVGGMGKGGSAGKGKGRVDPELSAEESGDEDMEGEGEGSGGGMISRSNGDGCNIVWGDRAKIKSQGKLRMG